MAIIAALNKYRNIHFFFFVVTMMLVLIKGERVKNYGSGNSVSNVNIAAIFLSEF